MKIVKKTHTFEFTIKISHLDEFFLDLSFFISCYIPICFWCLDQNVKFSSEERYSRHQSFFENMHVPYRPKSDKFSLFFDSIQRYPDESCEQKTIQFIIRNISFRKGFFRLVFPGKNDIPLYFDLFLMSGSEWISILVTSLFFRIYLIYQHVSYRPKLNNRLNFGQILIK